MNSTVTSRVLPNYVGRPFKESDSLHKKQMAVEKMILALEDKIHKPTKKPRDGGELAQIKQEIIHLKELRYKLLEEQNRAEHTVVGKMCRIWKTLTFGSKEFVIHPPGNFNPENRNHIMLFMEHVDEVFDKGEITDMGSGHAIRAVRAGRDLSFADIKRLTEHRLARNSRLGKPFEKESALLAYFQQLEDTDCITEASWRRAIVAKPITPFRPPVTVAAKLQHQAEVVSDFFDSTGFEIIKETGLNLITSDRRVSVLEDGQRQTSKRMQELVQGAFGGEVKVGETHRSHRGKTNIAFTRVNQGGEERSLSKADLIEVTVAKMESLRNTLAVTPHDEGHSKAIEQLNTQLVNAEKLVEVLLDKNVLEYLSKKREMLFAVLKGIAQISDIIDYVKRKPLELYDRWQLNHAFKVLTAKAAMGDLRERVDGAVQNLGAGRADFEKAYLDLLRDYRDSEKMVQNLFSYGNRTLHEAIDKGNTRAIHFIISQGLYRNVTAKTLDKISKMSGLSLDARSLIIKELFARCSEHQEVIAIIDHLNDSGNVELLKELLLGVLAEEKENIAGFAQGQIKHLPLRTVACMQLAAKIGSPEVLQAAFGLEEGADLSKVIEAMKPFVFLPDPRGATLLEYACYGISPVFVMGIGHAIKEKYLETTGTPPITYREAKKQAMTDFLAVYSDKLQSTKKKEAALDSLVEAFPDLQYVKDYYKKSPYVAKELEDPLETLARGGAWIGSRLIGEGLPTFVAMALENLTLDPFLAADSLYSRPIQRMSPSLAADMDAELEAMAKPIGGENVPVHCFSLAARYYQTLRSLDSPIMVLASLTGQIYAWLAYATKILAGPVIYLPGLRDMMIPTTPLLLAMYSIISSGYIGAWILSIMAEGRSEHSLEGSNRNLYQYKKAFPLDTPPGRANVDIPPPLPRDEVFLRDTSARIASRNPLTKSSLQERNIARRMDRQEVEGVIEDLENLQGKNGRIDGGRLLEGYRKIFRYPPGTRKKVLEKLFDLMEKSTHIEDILDIQLASGLQGRRCVQELLRERTSLWGSGEVHPKRHQYEAAVFAAAKMGDTELLRSLLDIKIASAELAASGRWKRASEGDTSYLLLAISSKIPESSRSQAVVVKMIYEEMIAAYRLELDANPFMKQTVYDPLTVASEGVVPLDVLSPVQASTLDEVFELNPKVAGSFTATVNLRSSKMSRDYTDEFLVAKGPTILIKNLAAPTANICGFAAALAAAKYGPMAMFAADLASRMVVLKVFSIFGATVGVLVGKKFTETLRQLESEVHAYPTIVSQLGLDQESIEKLIKEKAERGEKIAVVLDGKTDEFTYKYLLQGLLNAVKAADNAADEVSQRDLQEIARVIDGLRQRYPDGVTHQQLVDTLKECFEKADVPLSLRFIVMQPLFDSLKDVSIK